MLGTEDELSETDRPRNRNLLQKVRIINTGIGTKQTKKETAELETKWKT